jgi:hypothetical protein
MDILPKDITLRCNNVKMCISSHQINNNTDNKIMIFPFPLPREFDIIFSVNSATNAEHIVKNELCLLDGEKITDIQLNKEIVCSLYFWRYCPLCIKIEYNNIIPLPDKVELIYSTGKLTKYRLDRIN